MGSVKRKSVNVRWKNRTWKPIEMEPFRSNTREKSTLTNKAFNIHRMKAICISESACYIQTHTHTQHGFVNHKPNRWNEMLQGIFTPYSLARLLSFLVFRLLYVLSTSVIYTLNAYRRSSNRKMLFKSNGNNFLKRRVFFALACRLGILCAFSHFLCHQLGIFGFIDIQSPRFFWRNSSFSNWEHIVSIISF